MTSAAHRDFVASLGCYDSILSYDDTDVLPSGSAAVYVDFAGSASVRTAVHEHLADRLKFSYSVGFSHREHITLGGRLPEPEPVFFFAADRLRKRTRDWLRDGIDARFEVEWRLPNAFPGR